jgi:DHA2 family multidrug resistance protein
VSRGGINLTTATTKAYAMISNAVDRQAYYLSYLDTFRLITIFFILVVPLVVFLKTKKEAPEDKAAIKAALAEAH